MTNSVIAVDFDGTLAEHLFPKIGAEVPGAFAVLKELQAADHRLILWTMRDDLRAGTGPEFEAVLTKAVEWCSERGVEFWSVNCNPDQGGWSCSPKCYANVYIDDAALGCPLRAMPKAKGGDRLVVDWKKVRALLAKRGYLKPFPKGCKVGSKFGSI